MLRFFKNNYVILFVLALGLMSASCENDDICLEPGTPRLIITFYDDLNPTIKKPVSDLLVQSTEYGTIFNSSSTDSIALPLQLDSSNFEYDFSAESSVNPVQISFEKEDIFVNRSCGYKTTFNTLEMISLVNDQWIKRIEILDSEIKDEKESHVKIYH